MMQMWIRGVLCNIDGCVELADWSVGIMGEYFIAESIVRADNGEEMPELTDGEQESISDAYFDALPFDPENHCVYAWREWDFLDVETVLEVSHYIWMRHWIPDTRTMMDFLKAHSYMVSREGKQVFASNGELKRWFERGSVEVNGRKAKLSDPWPAVCDSVVIHPNGRNRTTLL